MSFIFTPCMSVLVIFLGDRLYTAPEKGSWVHISFLHYLTTYLRHFQLHYSVNYYSLKFIVVIKMTQISLINILFYSYLKLVVYFNWTTEKR